MKTYRVGDQVTNTGYIHHYTIPRGTPGTVEMVKNDGYMVRFHTGAGFDPVLWVNAGELEKR